MKTTHREATTTKRLADLDAMTPEKKAARRHSSILGWVLVLLGIVVILAACVALVMSAIKGVAVGIPLIVLLLIGIGVAIYGAHVLPSTTAEADAWMKDALDSVAGLLPGRRR